MVDPRWHAGREEDHILDSWSVVTRFEHIAEVFQDCDAVVSQCSRLTYRELNERANKVAHRLIELGIKPEESVGLAISKSCDLIIAQLGILKAGGVYVPLVANQPVVRLRTIVEDVGCRFFLVEDGYLDRLEGPNQVRITVASCEQCSAENPLAQIPSDRLAYILFTSGSTGVPKGVMIEHSGIIRLVCEQAYLPFGPEFHYLFAAPMSFDVSTLEIFTPLLHGAKLVVVPEGDPDPQAILALCRRERVQSTCMAFGLFTSLFEVCPEIFEQMPVVAVGGEQVLPAIIAKAQHRLPSTRFVNAYGPTEATMLATTYPIPDNLDPGAEAIPIGQPLDRVRAHVLDEHLNPVNHGEIGELCLAGVGIARGYLNREEITEERFVAEPGYADQGRCMYRTGDRVKLDNEGNLVFVGRMDDQVKVRGYRIELGEIESGAMTVEGIGHAAAAVYGSGTDQSIGLLVVTEGIDVDTEKIRLCLAEILPGYMIPSLILKADALPLNRNGKVDRKSVGMQINKLAEEQRLCLRLEKFETETQRQTAAIISQILGVDVLSADDHFLHLGGHSLRAVVLSSRVRDRFDIGLSISKVYQLGTVRAMAGWIDEQVQANKNVRLTGHNTLCVVDQGKHAVLSFNQQRLWMLDQIHPHDPSYNITIRLLLTGQINRQAFGDAWNVVCSRHEVLRSRIEMINEQPKQVAVDQLKPLIHWVDCNDEAPDAIDRMIERESMRVFDLEIAPLYRCCVYAQGNRSSIVITMHHIISDAWSCEVLQRELNEAYIASIKSRSPSIPELPIQYRDFAYWQRQLPASTRYQADLEYWKQKLSGIESIELPTDHPRGFTPSTIGRRIGKRISKSDSLRIRSSADRLGVTPYAYMLGLFKVWIYRLTGQEDLVVGTPIANREWTQIEGLIGFFMETVALRTKMSCHECLRDLIPRVSEIALEAFDHRDVPFQHIVDALPGHASNGRNPLFEVFFNHIALNIRSGLGDNVIRFDEMEIDNKTAKFDLTCYVFDASDSIEVVFNYRSKLFEHQTIDRFLDQYIRLLCSADEHLDSGLSQLPILDPDEPCKGAAFGNDSSINTSETSADLIHERVGLSVRLYPDHPAIVWKNGSVSYAQLWDRSGAILAELRKRGIGVGDRVMVSAEDPTDLGAAILGVLRVGGVYIPLDPHWPDHRIKQIESSLTPVHAVVDSAMSGRFAAFGFQGKVLTIDEVSQNGWDDEQPSQDSTPDSPAYILFTSGSTGEPKGVVQSHAGVISHMLAFARSLEMGSEDRVLQVSSPAFDAAVMDMFSAWFTGATLCWCNIQKADHSDLAEFINTSSITIYHSAPSVFRWFTGSVADDSQLRSVRVVVLGGEPVIRDDADSLCELFPCCELFINGMGLTESSLALQLRVHPRDLRSYTRWIPVGFAASDSTVRLVDRQGDPTELTGEIEIESSRIALGYWDQESKSIRQIGSSVQGSNSRRLRTGDRGTMLADGSIVHIGRVDQQVQVHGCRVEVDEVTAAIKSIEDVVDAAVWAIRKLSGDHELRCCVVVENAHRVTEHELRESLSKRLPRYMIPAGWVRVEQIPRVGGGKLDRRSLQEIREIPFASLSPSLGSDVSELELRIQSIFEQILGEPMVGVNDNFFRLGGNSLKAIRVFSVIRKEMGVDLPIATIYRASTPKQLAEAIESRTTGSDSVRSFIPLSNKGELGPVYLFPGIGGQPMGFAPLVDKLRHNRPYIGVQLPDQNQMREVGTCLNDLAAWFIGRMDLEDAQKAPDMIGYSFGGALAIEIAIQLQGRGLDPGLVILLDAHLPFGLPKKNKAGLVGAHFGELLRGGDNGRIAYVRSRISGDRYIEPERVSEDHADLQAYRALARTNRQMITSYKPSAIYEGSVCLLRGIQPLWHKFHIDDGYNGWSAAVIRDRIQKQSIRLTHLEVLKEGAAGSLAEIVNTWIAHQSM